ncbi:MAG: hypothetical protein KDE52_01400 [Calditrichaeota bacterium]|nr:hypothetical protein [Calditrichota bacterium]MCB0269573.1 hypothetical protein [Calditrichota bacterium]MCB0298678.1 hypothetical protein [Calditrichota bacterium]MCB9070522.1 hypothetical protein [Calditrichia bacterium]
MRKSAFYTVIVMILVCIVTQSSVFAQTRFGIRTGVYTDVEDAFIGGDLLIPYTNRVYLNPNIEYVFVDEATLMTLNFDGHYDFPANRGTQFWAGGGLGVIVVNGDGDNDSSTDVGVNLLGGVSFLTRSVLPYIQGKLILSDNNEFVLAFGLRF